MLPTAVIGAGPVGLAAAAHLIERGRTPLVLEAGPAVGNAIRKWGHVRLFSPWRYMIDKASRRLLEGAGWSEPDLEDIPTGQEFVDRYLVPLSKTAPMASAIRFHSRVVSITRKGYDKVRTAGRDERPFVIRIAGPAGRTVKIEAEAVIDASGTWNQPNPLSSDGIPADGEGEARDRIHYGIPDVLGAARRDYAGKTTLVAGSGHSAFNVLLDLAELAEAVPGTKILWALRRKSLDTVYGGGTADALPARGALGIELSRLVEAGRIEVLTPFRASAVTRRDDHGLTVEGTLDDRPTSVDADRIVVSTGFRPDLSILSELRIEVDPWLECAKAIGPLIDPNLHSCGTVRPHGARELAHPEKGVYIVGMKSYGRAPTFLMATGYEQVRSVVADLVGDKVEAETVRLELPETGVCNTSPRPRNGAAGPVAAVASSGGCGTDSCGTTSAPVEEPVVAEAAASSCCGRAA